MYDFQVTWNNGESSTHKAENVYEAIEYIVHVLKIHPREIKCIERIDENV